MPAEDPAGQFTDLLVQAAGKAIPKTRFSKKNFPRSHGLMTVAKKAIKERKKVQRKFFFFSFSNPTLSNVQNLNF